MSLMILMMPMEAGLLERRGDRKGRSYLLSTGIYRELGQPEAYVRARCLEPVQIEQMVLQYVQAHGRIPRRETAELCRTSENQKVTYAKRFIEYALPLAEVFEASAREKNIRHGPPSPRRVPSAGLEAAAH